MVAQAATVTEMQHSGKNSGGKPKAAKKTTVTPTADTNKIVREKCSRVVVDVRKVAEQFNCTNANARILAAAAEYNLTPDK